MSNGDRNPASIYEFQRDIFDPSSDILKEKVNNGQKLSSDECFDMLVSIKNLEKQIKMHHQEITVRQSLLHLECLAFFVVFIAQDVCVYCSWFLILLFIFCFYLQSTIGKYCSKKTMELETYWNELNGGNVVECLESKWMKWTNNDTIKWFKFALASNYNTTNDYVIEALSDNDSDDSNDDNDESDSESDVDNQDDEKQQQSNVIGKENTQVDYSTIKQQLDRIKFRSKRHLPLVQNQFHLHSYGFENKNDRKILCQAIKQLIIKYPKTKDNNLKSKSKQRKGKNKEHNDDIEGFVQQT